MDVEGGDEFEDETLNVDVVGNSKTLTPSSYKPNILPVQDTVTPSPSEKTVIHIHIPYIFWVYQSSFPPFSISPLRFALLICHHRYSNNTTIVSGTATAKKIHTSFDDFRCPSGFSELTVKKFMPRNA
jgi:hypothetical protein